MIQQQSLTQNEVQKTILQNQKIQSAIDSHTKQTPLVRDPIQMAITNIINPVKNQVKYDAFDQNTTIQQIKMMSIMGFISKTYQQVLVYLIQQSSKPFYDQSGNVQYPDKLRKQVLVQLSHPQLPLQQRIVKLINCIKNQNRMKTVKRMIITKLFNSHQQILKKANYDIYFQDVLSIMFNPNSVPFQFNNQQIVKQQQSVVINKKLSQMKNSSDYNDVTNKQIVVILKTLYRQTPIKSQNKEHWKVLKPSQQLFLIDKKRLRFLQQASVLQHYQQNVQKARNTLVKDQMNQIDKNIDQGKKLKMDLRSKLLIN